MQTLLVDDLDFTHDRYGVLVGGVRSSGAGRICTVMFGWFEEAIQVIPLPPAKLTVTFWGLVRLEPLMPKFSVFGLSDKL